MSISVLAEKIIATQNPSVIGLDPKLEYIPEKILRRAVSEYGETPEAAGQAIFDFNRDIIDAAAGIAPAVKPQSAFYEMYGFPGLAALEKTVRYARDAGIYVILDAKRGDIGSTAEAYASAYLDGADLFGRKTPFMDADSLTVNPYLGIDGVKPFIDACSRNQKSIFVLVKTSNPSSGDFQDVMTGTGPRQIPLYERVAQKICEWGDPYTEANGYHFVGAVVGATYPRQLAEARAMMPHAWILVPGYGAQGGGAAEIIPAFGRNGLGAIVNSSRGIMCAYQKKSDPENYKTHIRGAIIEMKNDIAGRLGTMIGR